MGWVKRKLKIKIQYYQSFENILIALFIATILQGTKGMVKLSLQKTHKDTILCVLLNYCKGLNTQDSHCGCETSFLTFPLEKVKLSWYVGSVTFKVKMATLSPRATCLHNARETVWLAVERATPAIQNIAEVCLVLTLKSKKCILLATKVEGLF